MEQKIQPVHGREYPFFVVKGKDLQKVYSKMENEIQNFNSKMTDGRIRDHKEKICKIILGKIAEEALEQFLIKEFSECNPIITKNKFSQTGNFELYDLALNIDKNKEITLELRTSFPPQKYLEQFPNNCTNLSLIGSYTSLSKKSEPQKDFFVQGFWDFSFEEKCRVQKISEIYSAINKPLSGKHFQCNFFLGGFVSKKSLEDFGSFSSLNQSGASYKIIRPISKTFSPFQFKQVVFDAITIGKDPGSSLTIVSERNSPEQNDNNKKSTDIFFGERSK